MFGRCTRHVRGTSPTPGSGSRLAARFALLGSSLLLTVVLGGSGCGSLIVPRAADQDRYHQNWWNFYRRGLDAMESGDFALAGQHFETCLGLRAGARFGYDAEKWRVRTYGVHMLNGYFPNRELGICYYERGQDTRAGEQLEKSLRLEPSGRAKHYLNLVRARLLQAQTVAPPSITVAATAEPVWTRLRQEILRGTAAGDARIRDLTIGGTPEFIELAEAQRPFARTLSLQPGTNVVSVVAHDLKGQTASAQVTWIADWRPPALIVSRIRAQGDAWLVDARCTDDGGLVDIQVDGIPYAGPGWAPGLASATLTIPVPKGRLALFQARDRAGNILKTEIQPGPLRQQAAARAAVRLAAATTDTMTDTPAAMAEAAPVTHGADREGPRIETGDAGAFTTAFVDEFFLDARIADAAGLSSVTLDGRELLATVDQGALQAAFAQRLVLAPGTNTFDLVARDTRHNLSSRRLVVVRQNPEYLNESFRLALVVPPLPSDEPTPVADQAKRLLESALLQDPPRFHLLERAEGWNAILQELRLSVSDLADPRASLRLGRLLTTDLLLQAALLRHGEGRTIYARLVDPATGEVVLQTDVYGEGQAETLAAPIEGLVMKIEQQFPLLHGAITDVAGRRVQLNLGTAQGLAPTARFIVVGRAAHTGTVRRYEERVVELRMRHCAENESTAEILPAAAAAGIQEGDYVFAR